MTTVIDPEGVTTTLSHDFAGHRTQIARAGRSWKYTYDTNGNMIAEQVPGSPNPPVTDPLYTTTMAYDDLDRPVSKAIAPRSLSSADQALFGVGTETYTWDIGGNHIGYLRYWRTDAPGATTPTVSLGVANNNQGQRTNTVETLTIAGYPILTRSFTQNYALFGGVRNTAYRDSVGGNNETTSVTYYDARGLPSMMHLSRPGTPTQTVAIQTRNVAGLVTKRRTDLAGTAPPMAFVESNWTYDTLGRVSSQVVQQGPGPTPVVRQDLAYFGNDDPKSLDHYLGTTKRTFQYGFDLRHQLTSTTETTTAGYFSATYNYGTAGRLTHVREFTTATPLPGSDVTTRDVNYQYAGMDPEQVTALSNVAGGATFASYVYDLAGNQTSRVHANGDRWDYVYDGKDQLRRATKKNAANVVQGSEEYWYDGFGQRIAIVKRDGSGTKMGMIWFIGDTEAHYDATGTVTHVYSHLSLGTPVVRVDRTANTTTAVEYQFHGFANNTIAAIENGDINTSFSYAPFGEIIEATDGGGTSAGIAAHRRRLNDKYVDELTDLAYYGARYYDKLLIGWTQSDPLYRFRPDAAWTRPRLASLYTTDVNNPLRYLDPDGRTGEATADLLHVSFDLAAKAAAFFEQGTPVSEAEATVTLIAATAVASAAVVVLRAEYEAEHPPISIKREIAEHLGIIQTPLDPVHDITKDLGLPPEATRWGRVTTTGQVEAPPPPANASTKEGGKKSGKTSGDGTKKSTKSKRAPHRPCSGPNSQCEKGVGRGKVKTSGEMNTDPGGHGLCDDCAGKARKEGVDVDRVTDDPK